MDSSPCSTNLSDRFQLRRVHFGETMENAVSDAANAPTDELDKAKITDDLIPASPKATLKRATPRRPFFHLQTSVEQVWILAAVSWNGAAFRGLLIVGDRCPSKAYVSIVAARFVTVIDPYSLHEGLIVFAFVSDYEHILGCSPT